ncbi:hypothetical protein [Aquisphaera insulae]|uniref:hypothetical protein n=1 Tax=Aquisphaera insulae TaxID=2712864 RepID=UPI0013EBC59C|nr:hypothetical protein [Aquisphaera insulae]
MDAKQDALELLAATGDLASRKITPALQETTRHGRLEVPVVGVARAGRQSSSGSSWPGTM